MDFYKWQKHHSFIHFHSFIQQILINSYIPGTVFGKCDISANKTEKKQNETNKKPCPHEEF